MTSIADLRSQLVAYTPWDKHEAAMQSEMIIFLDSHVDCLLRTELTGHFTASAWVVDLGTDSVLMIHHRKLNRWLQPGGHADGEADLLSVAMREVMEETGLKTNALSKGIFDLDIHEIPARAAEPKHLHLDVRFLLAVEPGSTMQINEEINAARWIRLPELPKLVQDRSILRMVEKSPHPDATSTGKTAL